ncbi:MAG: multiheme c-type cytochrome, partial [Candidatus Zixiibacteriota bacterium]
MRKITNLTLVLFSLFFFLTQNINAEEASKDKEKHAFVGVKKCKSCHKDKFKSWSKTPHAKTFDLLSEDEKKKPECLKCHTTGSL